jgi:hypothetical protein
MEKFTLMPLPNEKRLRYSSKPASIYQKAKFLHKYGKRGGRALIQEASGLHKMQRDNGEKYLDEFARFGGRFFTVANFGGTSINGGTSPTIDSRADVLANMIIANTKPEISGYVVKGILKPDDIDSSQAGITASISSISRKLEERSGETQGKRLAVFPDLKIITAFSGLSEYAITSLIESADRYEQLRFKVGIVAVIAPKSVPVERGIDNPYGDRLAVLDYIDTRRNENWRRIS